MTSPYSLFYGGDNTWKNGIGHKVFKFLMPGWCTSLKESVVAAGPNMLQAQGAVGMFLRLLLSLLVVVVFLFVFYGALSVLQQFSMWNDFVLRTKNALSLTAGFEGVGAVTTRDVRLGHLGSLDGLPYVQQKLASDRFTGGEPPVFFDAPSYVTRKDEMINNALGDYSREKAAGTTSLSWKDWLALNGGRYGTFGESAASLASLGRDLGQQTLANEGGMRFSSNENFGERANIPGAAMMGLY